LFERVLVANRGAIACRIIRTLDRLGVESVALFSSADAFSLHVEMATEAVELGEGRAAETYMDVDRVLRAARETGAEAIHPGYGFLSESPDFARRCEAAGIAFVGPTPEQIESFGRKHTARALAREAGVPLLAGSGLLGDLSDALAAAEQIGFPLMLKSTAGGGGIGMARCDDAKELTRAFESVQRLADAHFGDAGVFLERRVERARHVEVQVFGDGRGRVVSLGDRDCSVQRRNQKVVEEAPAPGLDDATRRAMAEAAERLCAAVRYRSAGTVEFLCDAARGDFSFLEVNTRLQVEHGVTEAVTGIDLVEWMLRTAAGDTSVLDGPIPAPRGHAVEARVYAESPVQDFRPSTGLVTGFSWPGDVRCDHWLTNGIEITSLYDPMLAKLVARGDTRDEAIDGLAGALANTRVHGVATNREFLQAIVAEARFRAGAVETSFLDGLALHVEAVEVLEPGIETTIQDWPGRRGFWHVGVPPSGPMDGVAHRIANRLVGNPEGATALEVVHGLSLRFHSERDVAVCGADTQAEIDGRTLPGWRRVRVAAGSVLRLQGPVGPGQRAAVAVRGGFEVPAYLGSRATFALGGFGGHGGRRLRPGDLLPLGSAEALVPGVGPSLETASPPEYCDADRPWQIDVTYGPHGAPEFFTEASIRSFFEETWEVHYQSSRTGIRLVGPKPEWARADGGEAGLHPSNLHDNAYAIGTIDFTGDMPVILGLDGPSLGGFVCPMTVVQADLWKLGQLAAGDRVRFRPVSLGAARRREREWQARIAEGSAQEPPQRPEDRSEPAAVSPILAEGELDDGRTAFCVRRSGDRALLLELGEMTLDLGLRLQVHAVMLALESRPIQGLIDLTPGVRSLQVHYDSLEVDEPEVLDWLLGALRALPPFEDTEVPTRVVHLPLAWDHSETRRAIDKYMKAVRADAPWCPDNIEFIRRINGLERRDDVRDVVYGASYVVMGLGDVYLGAPVATPIDPRQRLVTTKYNPARTWTPENAVGIGGAYLCIYGMEGPGGYQFVGRTVQMWNRFRETAHFRPGRPWLLRFFDQIRFHPVSEAELDRIRRDLIRGTHRLEIEEGVLRAEDLARLQRDHAEEIEAVRSNRERAFGEERERWRKAGLEEATESLAPQEDADEVLSLPPGAIVQSAPLAGSVWSLAREEGDAVRAGDTVLVLESMKTEIPVEALAEGRLVRLLCRTGQVVEPGQPLFALLPGEAGGPG